MYLVPFGLELRVALYILIFLYGSIQISVNNMSAFALGRPRHTSNRNSISSRIQSARVSPSQDLRRVGSFLDELSINYKFRCTGEVQRATQSARDVKTLVLTISGSRPVVCILPVALRVSYAKVAALLNVPTKALQMAPPDQAVDLTGYSIGTIPPLAHAHPADLVIVDETVRNFGDQPVYVGSGEAGVDLELSAADLLTTLSRSNSRPIIADITMTPLTKQQQPSAVTSVSYSPSLPLTVPLAPEQLGQYVQRDDGLVALEAVVGPRRRMSKLL